LQVKITISLIPSEFSFSIMLSTLVFIGVVESQKCSLGVEPRTHPSNTTGFLPVSGRIDVVAIFSVFLQFL